MCIGCGVAFFCIFLHLFAFICIFLHRIFCHLNLHFFPPPGTILEGASGILLGFGKA